jgi:hypothetical protein
MPSPSSEQIGWKRNDSAASSCSAALTRSVTSRRRCSSPRRRASWSTSSWITPRVTSAERLACPAAARLIDSSTSSIGPPLTTYPTAPASSISTTVARSSCADSATTRVSRARLRISRAAVAPPPPGMRTSSSATSGRSRTAPSIAWSASSTAATSSSPGSRPTSSTSASRTAASSSASSTRISAPAVTAGSRSRRRRRPGPGSRTRRSCPRPARC